MHYFLLFILSLTIHKNYAQFIKLNDTFKLYEFKSNDNGQSFNYFIDGKIEPISDYYKVNFMDKFTSKMNAAMKLMLSLTNTHFKVILI